MSELLFNSLNLTRSFFIKNVEALDESLIDVQPEGFNNTIHWHVGHVLTAAETLVLGFPEKSTHLPVNYMELFSRGTKPADWQGDVPSVLELIEQLKDQQKRIKEITEEKLSQKLKEPFFGQETVAEMINFTLFHESLHLGHIQAMKRIIETAKK